MVVVALPQTRVPDFLHMMWCLTPLHCCPRRWERPRLSLLDLVTLTPQRLPELPVTLLLLPSPASFSVPLEVCPITPLPPGVGVGGV